jgi:hypothetical protein
MDISGEKNIVQNKKKKKHKRKWKEINGSEETEDNTGGNKGMKNLEKMEGFTIIGTEHFKNKEKVCLMFNSVQFNFIHVPNIHNRPGLTGKVTSQIKSCTSQFNSIHIVQSLNINK